MPLALETLTATQMSGVSGALHVVSVGVWAAV
jgi:hypothetical protein